MQFTLIISLVFIGFIGWLGFVKSPEEHKPAPVESPEFSANITICRAGYTMGVDAYGPQSVTAEQIEKILEDSLKACEVFRRE